jgi:hypothetical protein
MRQKLKIHGEFLLPEGFSGGFREAFQLYYDYYMKKDDNSVKYPATLPEEFCFQWTVERGGLAYTTFSIESYKLLDIEESIEIDDASDEEWENDLCLDSNP